MRESCLSAPLVVNPNLVDRALHSLPAVEGAMPMPAKVDRALCRAMFLFPGSAGTLPSSAASCAPEYFNIERGALDPPA
ncbi:MAG TPA: hypothetical protein VF345_06885 [Chthoniobacterales bacterium]